MYKYRQDEVLHENKRKGENTGRKNTGRRLFIKGHAETEKQEKTRHQEKYTGVAYQLILYKVDTC
jgi:hypothetical protein